MNRRQRNRAVTFAAWLLGLGLVGWDLIHGRWETALYYVGGLVVLVVGLLFITAWVDRGDP